MKHMKWTIPSESSCIPGSGLGIAARCIGLRYYLPFLFAWILSGWGLMPPQVSAADYSDWMTDHWSQIKGKTLRQLVIPGSHDSGAYDMINAWEFFDPRFGKVEPDFAGPDTAESASKFVAAGPFFEAWSQTQDKDIYEQLTDGIRFLDIRAAVDPSGDFRAVHSLYGDTIDIILEDIRKFSEEHPQELIYVRFDHFHDFGLRTEDNFNGGTDKMRWGKHNELIHLINDSIGDRLIANWSPDRTLESLREDDSKRRILLFYNYHGSVVEDDEGSPPFPGDPDFAFLPTFVSKKEYAGNGDWVNPSLHKGDPATFKSLTLSKINGFRNQKLLHRIGTVTPTDAQFDAWYQDGKFAGNNPKSLKQYAEDTNPVLAKWITEEWANLNLSIIAMDFYPDYLLPMCLRLNGVTVPDFTIPEDNDWGNYRNLEEILDDAYTDASEWTETAVADVGDWFETAWSDVSTFFVDTANAFADIFYEDVYSVPATGTPPAGGVVAGIRHYVITASAITADRVSGDGGDNVEIYGELFMVPSYFCSTDPGSNATFWSATESNAKTLALNGSTIVSHAKNIYVTESLASSAEVALGGSLVEDDFSLFPGGGDDFTDAIRTVALGGFQEGESRIVDVNFDFGGDQIVHATFVIERRVAPLIQSIPQVLWSDLNFGDPVPVIEIDRLDRIGDTAPLTGFTLVPGRFEYRPQAGEFLRPGTRAIIAARFIPNDTRRYTETTITREVVVRPVNRPVPGRVEAESFDAWRDPRTGILTPLIEATGDTGGGQEVSFVASGSSFSYEVTVAEGGGFLPGLRVATIFADSQLRLIVDGEDVSGPVRLPEQPDFGRFETVTFPAVYLEKGRHRIEVENVAGTTVLLNYLDFNIHDIESYGVDFRRFSDGTSYLDDGSRLEGPGVSVQDEMLVLAAPVEMAPGLAFSQGTWTLPPLSRDDLPTELGFLTQFSYQASGVMGRLDFRFGDLVIEFNRPGAGSFFGVRVNGQLVPGGSLSHPALSDGESHIVLIRWSRQSGEGRLTMLITDDGQLVPLFRELPTPGFKPAPEDRMSLNAGSPLGASANAMGLMIGYLSVEKLEEETRVLSLNEGSDWGVVSATDGRIEGRFTVENNGNAPLTIHSFELPDGVTLDWNGGVLLMGEEREISLSREVAGSGDMTWTITVNSDATEGADAQGRTVWQFRATVLPQLDPLLTDVTAPGDPVVLVNGVNDDDANFGPPPATEGVEHVIDNVGQKYLNFLDLGSGFIVTPAVGPTRVTALRLYPANDAVERDPGSYRLEGSTGGPEGPFVLIAEGPLALPMERNSGGDTPLDPSASPHQVVQFENTTAYLSYRLVFPTLRNAAGANSMQIGEVEFLGTATEVIPPGPLTMESYRQRTGETFRFVVTGSVEGAIYGTDIYTDDSILAVAVVHAGVLAPGEKGVVEVTVLPGQDAYPGTMRNGVTSIDWAEWGGSYSVRPARKKPEAIGVGLIAHWAFDDAATPGRDSVGGNTLAAQGNAQSTPTGKFGGGLLLDGDGDYLSIVSGSILNLPVGNSPYTIGAWFRTPVSGRGIVGWGNYGDTRRVNALRLIGDGILNYWWGADLQATASPTILDDQWHHVTATYDGTTRTIYIDGVERAEDTPGTLDATASNFRIGSTNSGEFFDGTLDEVALWNRMLTPEEIEALSDYSLVHLLDVGGGDGSPVPVRIRKDGANLSIIYSSGSRLQRANTVLGPWETIPGATSPYSVDLSEDEGYFRAISGNP